MKPVIVAIVAQALARLAKGVVKSWWLGAVTAGAVAAAALGVNELLILAAAGILAAVVKIAAKKRTASTSAWLPLGVGSLGSAAAAKVSVALVPLFLVFLKVGSVLFGSGYVLLAFVQAELVTHRGWITQGQLLDAVAVGQITPGPLSTTATFIGYLLAGPAGAGVATVGIFLPSFVFVALSAPLIPRLRSSAVAGGFLDGVNVASLALMAVVTAQLGAAAITDAITVALALLSAAALLRWRVNSVWVLIGGAVTGLAAKFCHLA